MHDDVERTRQGYAAFARGDLDEIRELLDPDIVWRVPGRSELSGTYRGIDDVIGYFLRLFERSGGTFKADLVEAGQIAPGLVAALVHMTGTLPGGTVDTRAVQVLRLVDGRAAEVSTFNEDQYAVDEAVGGGAVSVPGARQAEQSAAAST